MLKEEAKRAILLEWRQWSERTGNFNVDGLRFFGFLRTERPDLLNFRSSGDKWQVISGWLQNALDL